MDNISSIEQLERRLARAERRLRATWSLAFVGTLGAFVLGLNPQARAQFGVTLTSLNNRLTAAENKLTAVDNDLAAVETKTQYVSVSGTDMLITGANLHIRDGSGSTSGTVNGLGNLIIGYNEVNGTFGDERGGSHNLVIGLFHDYTSYGGMVVGYGSRITGAFASVTGGVQNTASNFYASVSGGSENTASGIAASVSGGRLIVQPNYFGWSAGGNFYPGTGIGTFYAP